MSKKNLIVHMEGGFGNQLFQYFFGKSCAKKFNRNLYFDTKEDLNCQLLIQEY